MLLFLTVSARTWHPVNQFDLQGNQCPALVRLNQPCPLVCASSIAQCPQQVRPAECPNGQFYCPDGTCKSGVSLQSACAGAKPVCSCNHGFVYGFGDNLVPCLGGQLANVTSLSQNVHTGDAPLVAQCAQDVGLNINQMTNPLMLQCKPGSSKILSGTEPEFVLFYTVLSIQFFILMGFYFYKAHKNTVGEVKTTSMFAQGLMEMENVVAGSKKQSDLTFVGYSPNFLGTFVKFSVYATSLMWIALFIVLVGDYYEAFSSISYRDQALLFVDHNNLSRVFVALWHLSLFWFIGLLLCAEYLKTAFLVKTPLTQHPLFVLVKKNVKPPIRYQGLGPIVEWIHAVERPFRKWTKSDVQRTIVPVKWTDNGSLFIEFECVRYVFDPASCTFEPFDFELGKTSTALLANGGGLDQYEATRRINLNGPNQILFEIDSFVSGLFKEFTGVFYLYQFMMLIIWWYYAYYYMAIVLTAVVIGSGVIKVVVSHEAQQRVVQMATYNHPVTVLRDGQWETLDSTKLVPGDVIQIKPSNEFTVSVDVVLLSGDAVVDESSLTGEALPVAKSSIKSDGAPFSVEAHGKRNCIFAGCHVLETQPEKTGVPVTALVLATGAGTQRGRLVRDILFPAEIVFVFIEQLKLVVPILLVWGIIMLFASMSLLEIGDIDSWFYGMFTISQILSPLLPAVLVIGQSISAQRLAGKGIMCVDFSRITLAAKVSVMCFDKTGTMTKEGLDFVGSQEVNQQTNGFQAVRKDFDTFSTAMKLAMLSCHSLSLAAGQIVGNFVDVEMFKATGAALDAVTPSRIYPLSFSGVNTLQIIRRFEFVHAHAYMSVVVQDQGTGKLYVFLKGSFEKIKSLVQSTPEDYVTTAENQARRGCYVVAFAFKELDVSLQEAQDLPRSELESGCAVLGLNLFRNELKPDTRDVLEKLRAGAVRPVMITGDHALTAIFIAQECGLVGPDAQVCLVDYVDNKIVCADYQSKDTMELSELENMLYHSYTPTQPIELVVTGAAFRHLHGRGWIQAHLQDIRIYARMSPDDKVNCVRSQMAQNITGMCGDGGNDAGALKQAHVGVAISEAESSVVAHFSSSNRSLECCVDLLREARCSLDVGFASYKYLLIYGETLAFSGLAEYYFNVNMSQMTWVLIDGSTVPVSWALTLARPSKALTSTRPTARLLGPETFFSVAGPVLINILFTIITLLALFGQSFYSCHQFDGANADLRRWWELADNYEGAVLSILVMYQILHSAAAFNIGSKYRRGGFSNLAFVISYGLVFTIISLVLLLDPNIMSCSFRINCGTPAALRSLGYSVPYNAPLTFFNASGHNVIPMSFRIVLFLISLGNLLSLMLWEYLVILGPVRQWVINRWSKKIPLRL
ncbi:hypothetical protein EDD86DRAFT_235003 [Gorgonomyces haynaldii]|nr:hypothetical protein EDD86DRAFT_235003 [Gorgonomyces haynaldii]